MHQCSSLDKPLSSVRKIPTSNCFKLNLMPSLGGDRPPCYHVCGNSGDSNRGDKMGFLWPLNNTQVTYFQALNNFEKKTLFLTVLAGDFICTTMPSCRFHGNRGDITKKDTHIFIL